MEMIENRAQPAARAPILAPAPEVRFARYGGEVIVLDLARDSYLALGPAVSDALLWALHPADHTEPTDAARTLAPLRQRGLLVAAADGAANEPVHEPAEPGGLVDQSWNPQRSALFDPELRATTRQIAAAVGWLARADRQLRRGGTIGLVRWLRAQAAKLHVSDTDNAGDAAPTSTLIHDELAVLLAAGITARMIYPRHIACLVGSAALAAQAWTRQLDVRMEFGVQKYPFHAHAWVRHGDTVVNDGPEPARRLAPILTVGPVAGSR